MQQQKEVRPSEKPFSAILKRERILRGWSQADVAARIGSDSKTVGRWERGLTSPGPYLSQRLSELYGKTAQELKLVVDDEPIFKEDERSKETLTIDEMGKEDALAQQTAIQEVELPEHNFPSPEARDVPHSLAKWRGGTRGSLLLRSLLIVLLLLVALSAWFLHGIISVRPSKVMALPENPYTGQGILTLNDSLRTLPGSDGWSLSNTDEGQCFFADGAYRIRVIKTGGYMKLCLAEETYFYNFTYEVHMQVVAGDCGGLGFRSTFPQLYIFLVCQDGKYRFVRYDRDHQANRRIMVQSVSPAIKRGLHQINVLAVVAVGDRFTLYVNGQRVYQGTDGAYLDGQIGLLAHSCSFIYLTPVPDVCSVPIEALFSNVRVWKT